ncbi:MAG: hypothetical protein J07HX64_00250 [halophilic archaeon J07HX64]|nr:MAG: hypothetical protein J07HX64_00250 [halophilic archaeon J07HX64]
MARILGTTAVTIVVGDAYPVQEAFVAVP